MELTPKDIEQLEAYWQNNLSETDKLALENRLKTDALFRGEADKMHLITEGLAVVRQRQQRAHFDALDATLPEIKPSNSMGWLKFLLAALVLAIAAFSVWFFMFKKEEKRFVKPKISEPVAAYFEPYPALGITMGDEEKTVRLTALRAYAKKDYATAIPLLDKAFLVENDSLLLFYKGIAHVGAGESQQAISLFESLQTSALLPTDAVDWYLALAYLETKQAEKAAILLKKVANTEGGKYAAKARELMK